MTENEAIKHLQSYAEVVDNMIKYCKDFEPKADITGYLEKKTVFAMAISAIKEIQQYREVDAQIKKIFDDQLGLVDIVKEYIEDIRRTHNGKTPRKVIALSVMEDK